MFKRSEVSFSQLRKFLADLSFTETKDIKFWRFEHAPSGAVFLFRPYRVNEKVTMPDLITTRSQLDWRGVMAADEFDTILMKKPA